jgi:acyl-CoA synthetase (NDP forming)
MSELARLLAPRSIAIVGLSADATKHGRRVLDNLRRLGFVGTVWGVNPKLPELDDVEVVADLRSLPGSPDVVVSAVPAHLVPGVVRDAAEIDAGAVIVFAGGFGESGDLGGTLEADLALAARETGVRVLGPNSGGVIVPSQRLAMSFLTCLDRPIDELRTGPVGIVTQSGGTGSYIHNLAAAKGGGLAASISTGNEVDLGVADGILALVAMEDVRSIGVVIETARHGRAFIDAVRQAHDAGKPVVALQIGKSDRGQRLMRTHTGALARPTRVFEGVLDSLGVAAASTPEEMLEIAEILGRSPRPVSNRVGIVTHSGGIAIMLSDLIDGTSIALPQLGPDLCSKLRPLLSQGALDNPLDMGGIIGGAHRFGEVVSAVAESGDVDCVLAVSTAHPRAHSVGRAESMLALNTSVPVVHLWMAGDVGADGLDMLRAGGVAVTEEPRAAVLALAALGDRHERAPKVVGDRPLSGRTDTESQAKQLVESWGIGVVPGRLATTASAAAAVAEVIGFPCVVKINSPDIVHKTEIGGVLVDLRDRMAVEQGCDQVFQNVSAARPDAAIDGVLVERMVSGPEVIVGAVSDETFGPMVMVGIGGVVAEALDDVRMAPAPLSKSHALRMIESLAGLGLLTNPRLGSAANLESLAAIVVEVGDRIAAHRQIESVDLNPIVWSGSEWLVLDAVIDVADEFV